MIGFNFDKDEKNGIMPGLTGMDGITIVNSNSAMGTSHGYLTRVVELMSLYCVHYLEVLII